MALRPNKFKYNKIIVFTKEDKDQLLNISKKIKPNNIYFCPLAHKNYEELNNFNIREKINQSKNIVYMGRLDQAQKNIDFIAKISDKLINNHIYIYIWRWSRKKCYS